MVTAPGIDFLGRTLRTTSVVILVYLPFGYFYFGFYHTLAVFSGAVWGLLNLMFLAGVVRATIRAGGVDTARLVGFALIKFPLLYAAGYGLLKVPQFEPLHLLIGFSAGLAVLALKAAARAWLKLDNQPPNSEKLGEAV